MIGREEAAHTVLLIQFWTEMKMAERNKSDFAATTDVDATLQKTRQTVAAGADAARTAAEAGLEGAAALGRRTSDAMTAGIEAEAAAGNAMTNGLDNSAERVGVAASRLHDDTNAVFAVQAILQTGLQELRRDWAKQWQEAASRAVGFEQELSGCGSLPEIFDRRRQFVLEGIERVIERQAELLERCGQLWRRSLEPLSRRVGHARATASRNSSPRSSRTSSGSGQRAKTGS